MASTRLRRLAAAASLVLLTSGGAWTLGATSASAATTDRYVATTGSDTSGSNPSDCTSRTAPCKTIQHAVDEANGGDTINVAAGTYPESVLVGSVEADPNNLTIVGAGAGKTNVTGNPAASGDASFGIEFEGTSGTVRDLTAGSAGGSATGPAVGIEAIPGQTTFAKRRADVPAGQTIDVVDSDASGNGEVGLLSTGAATTVVGSRFDRNGGTSNEGCGISVGDATLSMRTSSASDNHGCGVDADGELQIVLESRQAAVPTAADVSVVQSTIAGNDVGGLLAFAEASTSAYDSTFSGNAGVGIVVGNTDLNVTHSTVSDTGTIVNLGEAGILVEDETNVQDAIGPSRLAKAITRATRYRATVRKHSEAEIPLNSTVTLAGTIDADNKVPDCGQHVTDSGYNLSSDKANSCGFGAAKHSLTKTDPKLGTLGLHGGLTQTQLPLKASPAIDAEPAGAAGCASGDVDQRGDARPQPTGGRCDIGSVELAARQLAISPDSLPHGTVGTKYSQTLTATGGQYPTYTWSLTKGDLPPGIGFAAGVFSGTPTQAGTYTVTVSVNDPVSKTYTIVIDAAGDHGNGSGSKLADTGLPTLAITGLGALLLVLGWAVLYAAGLVGRPGGRHRWPLG
jgi:hypothetical protein